MYAVVETGGKQYKVSKGDSLKVEKLEGKQGDIITLGSVIALGEGKDLTVGSSALSGATVTAEIVEQTKGDKVIVFKKKRRHNYRRKNGHRQNLTLVKISDIAASGGKSTTAKSADKAEAKPAPAKAAAKPAAKKTESKAADAKAPAKKAPAKKPAAPKTESK